MKIASSEKCNTNFLCHSVKGIFPKIINIWCYKKKQKKQANKQTNIEKTFTWQWH